ncbi:hypothetical protein Tco_0895347 [Tanacetum coccineum]|uniref:Uncharacterized protein n=1 Tax=Tanacetum coccineum TaxID=301880 RepID=A0ABQ5CED5_9ASTR
MEPLLPRAQRNLWLRYQVKGYTKDIVHDFEQRLDTIFGRHVNRVHVLDFAGLTKEMGQTLADRIRMVYFGAKGQALFTTYAWRRLFKIRGLLVREFILEFISTFYLASRFTYFQEMAEMEFEAYWLGQLESDPNIGVDFYSIFGRGLAPEKSISRGGRAKPGCRDDIYLGLLEHFGFVSDEGLMGLFVIARVLSVIDLEVLVKLNICVRVGDTWAWVGPGPERQPIAAAGAPEVTEGALDVEEGDQAFPATIQAH